MVPEICIMNVEIITIGDEILIGQIVDTNSAWMAQQLNLNGFAISQISSISDTPDHIKKTLDDALKRVDIVLITGGLGPTKDDKTKLTLCDYFHTRLVFSEEVYAHLEMILSRSNLSMNELNHSQANVPQDATIIQNQVGTAPVMWFERDNKVLVSMPGVPAEMKWAMTQEIIPRLQVAFQTNMIVHRHFLVHGYAESALAIRLEEWESALPSFIHLAYLPAVGLIKLRMSVEQQHDIQIQSILDEESAKLHAILGDSILTDDDIPIEILIGNLLREHKLTLATAESCTGGNIAKMITSVPGSSDYYKGSVVAYDNDVKVKLLGVSPENLAQYGAVSLPIVEQMAQGVLKLLDTDIAVATSGIAGPDGGTDAKPVGTVCIAVATKERVESRQFSYGQLRDKNITRSSIAALVMLKEIITGF